MKQEQFNLQETMEVMYAMGVKHSIDIFKRLTKQGRSEEEIIKELYKLTK